MDKAYIDRFLLKALEEDMPFGDITTDNIVDAGHLSEASMKTNENGILCGVKIAARVFELLDPDTVIEYMQEDGEYINKGEVILKLRGKTAALLKGERTALNILQRLSGIATTVDGYVREADGYDVRICDTRKTTPLFRMFEKYAVVTGGGYNHRYCLSDAVMIKDNHIEAAGGIAECVAAVRKKIPHTVKIEVEADSLAKARQAVEAGADIVMLDNMTVKDMREAVKNISGRAIVEASGNISIEDLREVASTGVDIISVGKLTHSVRSLDISMDIESSF